MKHKHKDNDVDRELLVAQLVYHEAVIRHRAEGTDQTHRMVLEAQQSLHQARRACLLDSWSKSGEHSFPCPRCGKPPRAFEWAQTDPEAPPWAQTYAEAGVAAARRYQCDPCGFELTYVASSIN